MTHRGALTAQDDTFRIWNAADRTKVAKLSVSGITTATTRTYTLPDVDTTLASEAEGAITPSISFDGAADGVTYTTQTGSYTKVGNSVRFRISIVLSSKGSSTGNLVISGLPFTNAAAFPVAISVRLAGPLGTMVTPQAYVNASAATITIENLSASAATIFTEASLGNTSQITLAGEYPA